MAILCSGIYMSISFLFKIFLSFLIYSILFSVKNKHNSFSFIDENGLRAVSVVEKYFESLKEE